MGRARVIGRLRLLLVLGMLSGASAPAPAATQTGHATAQVVAHVPAHLVISGPALVTVDLQDHRIGTPIPARLRFAVRANTQEVELQVACTDLYEAGNPTSGHRIAVADAGARITCEQGRGILDIAPLLPWRNSLSAGLLPAGWTGAVSETGVFTAAPGAAFNQGVVVDVSWNTTDPTLPLGEYRGYVELIGLVRP